VSARRSLTIALHPELADRIEAFGRRWKLTTSQTVEWALADWLGIAPYEPIIHGEQNMDVLALCPRCEHGVTFNGRCHCGWHVENRERLGYNRATAARFWSLAGCGPPEQCWPWQGPVDENGDGVFTVYRVPTRIHVLIWESLGKLGEPGTTCGDKLCANPGHLRARAKGQPKMTS
jgi:hypothetical protein